MQTRGRPTQQIEATSDFDLDESDSASEVFAIDEEDVDESAATAMGPAMAEEDSGEFDADDDSGIASSGWDVDSEPVASVGPVATSGPVISAQRGGDAEWGGLWVGFLGVGTILTLREQGVRLDRPDAESSIGDFHACVPARLGPHQHPGRAVPQVIAGLARPSRQGGGEGPGKAQSRRHKAENKEQRAEMRADAIAIAGRS